MREMKEALKEMCIREGIAQINELLAIKEAWEKFNTVKGAVPTGFQGRRLVVRVSSHPWAQELRYRTEDVKREIKKLTGIEIEGVIIKVKPELNL